MRQLQESKTIKTLHILLLALWLCFIFSNSLRTGEASNVQSEMVTGGLNAMLARLGLSALLSGGLVRTLAHFAEFAVLGALAALGLWLWKCLSARAPLLFALFACIGVAVTDEIVQAFVPERTASIADVLTDCAGILVGFFGIWLFFLFCRRHAKQR